MTASLDAMTPEDEPESDEDAGTGLCGFTSKLGKPCPVIIGDGAELCDQACKNIVSVSCPPQM